MNNTRFATLIHILTLLEKHPGQWLNSEWIAESILINPVIVRKEIAVLQQSGWVISKKGKEGGSMLHVSACQISLADIYRTVKTVPVLGKKNNCSDTSCPIGKEINKELEKLFEETDQILIESLKGQTLKSFVEQFS
jgi:DNA-binding IscR family transcriptional regulator